MVCGAAMAAGSWARYLLVDLISLVVAATLRLQRIAVGHLERWRLIVSRQAARVGLHLNLKGGAAAQPARGHRSMRRARGTAAGHRQLVRCG